MKRNEDGGDPRSISGLAAVYYRADDPGTQFELWDGVVERIMPGAFDESVENDDIRASFNHNLDQLLGRTKSGTLGLELRKDGLHYTISPAETSIFRDVSELIDRGDVDGSSIWFRVTNETWRVDEDAEIEIREIHEAQLFELGPVANPAYTSTDATFRAHDRYLAVCKERERSRKAKTDRENFVRAVALRSRNL